MNGIGHTRWATHGVPAERNAHPHIGGDNELAVIHNGIIENFQELKENLLAKGYVFKSETDTEVLAHLIAEGRKHNPTLLEAFAWALRQAHGAYAVAVICPDEPGTILPRACPPPLILGVGVGVSATYIFLFVLFGAFLKYSGFSDFINDLALTLVGRTAAGPPRFPWSPARSWHDQRQRPRQTSLPPERSPSAHEKDRVQAEFAAAVEAVASTGGQFAPPIMGAVGFIMAEFLGVPYTKVMLAAAIPAFLYYLTLLMAVHFEARKLGLKGLSPEHIPAAGKVLRERGHLFIPLIVLLWLIV